MSNENDQPSLRPHQEEAFRDLTKLDTVRHTATGIVIPAHLGKVGMEGSARPDPQSVTDEHLLIDYRLGISATPDRVAPDQRLGRAIRQEPTAADVQILDYTQESPDK